MAHKPLPMSKVPHWTSGVNVRLGQHLYYRRAPGSTDDVLCGYVWCQGATSGSWWVTCCQHTTVRVGGHHGPLADRTWAMLHLVVVAGEGSTIRQTFNSKHYNVAKDNRLVLKKASDLP